MRTQTILVVAEARVVGVAVIGAAGYAGIEAVRWVLGHPRLELTLATSGADAGRVISDVYPSLAGTTDLKFAEPDVDVISSSAAVAILAVPHTAAMGMVPQLLEAGLKVVDLSADFRLADPAVYEHWYGTPHSSPDLLADAVYGLPELDRSRLPGAHLVACPGCYPTATIRRLPRSSQALRSHASCGRREVGRPGAASRRWRTT
jgi:N-acetyl-gamma-glutamyl-phosphate reductase